MNWQSPTLRAGGGRQTGRCCPAVGHSLSHGVTGTIAAQSHRGILGTCLLREGTVQPGEPSAVWRYRSWGGCKKKFAFLVKISHLHLDSHASNIFPFSSITYLWCFDTGIWLLEPVIWLPKVFLSVIIIILTTHPPKNLWLVHFCYFSSSPF